MSSRFTAGAVALIIALAGASAQCQSAHAPTATVLADYHSWTNVVSVNNGLVEALVNPTTGRVAQFRFVGDTNGVLWENAALFGHTATQGGDYNRNNNFGGDKTWPSPQSAWGWPPPRGFDGIPETASITNGTVTLVSTVDSRYKIQATRVVELIPNEPVMRVTTTFERMAETAQINNPLGVWIDCQVAVATNSRCYVPVASPSIFTNGYALIGSAYGAAGMPPAFSDTNGLISFGVPPSKNQKMGFDGGTLALVGNNLALRIEAPRVAGANYPDSNSSAEVYTAQDYFELEMMGPMAALPVGSKMQFVTTYSIFRRTEATMDAEAQKVLSWKY